jgi:hypothetical protein
MIDADGALGHHFFKIPKTERIGHIPSHAQQHHIQRIMKPLQNLGNTRTKGLSRCRGLLHRGPKQSVGNPNFNAASLLRQNHRKAIFNRGMTPNIPENPRRRKTPKRGRKQRFDPAIFEERFRTIERVFAWEDKSVVCYCASNASVTCTTR